MDGTVHCGAADHDSIKLLAMAVVADGKKGGLSFNGCRNVLDVLRLVTALSFFLSLSLSVAVSLFLSLFLSRLYWRAPVTTREHSKILLLAGLYIRCK